jgi:hypothetical protein
LPGHGGSGSPDDVAVKKGGGRAFFFLKTRCHRVSALLNVG